MHKVLVIAVTLVAVSACTLKYECNYRGMENYKAAESMTLGSGI